jgi:glutathione synthase
MAEAKYRVGVIMDPIDHIKPKKDTTLALMLEAQRRGCELHYMEQSDLLMRDGQVFASRRLVEVRDDPKHWFAFRGEAFGPLAELDVILMRKDPPVDQEYLYTTYLLERVEHAGVLVVNRPQALREVNEKLYTAWFGQCTPPTLVTSSDPNLGVVIETLTRHQARPIMAQRYIPDIVHGDKRILMIDGEPVSHALARIPAAGETRGNLAAGGRGEGRELTERDRWIAGQVGPTLREKGLLFVGLDVIGDYLTEINVTSPTCARELDALYGLNIAGQVFDAIERRLAER